jgi:hypothetical protein
MITDLFINLKRVRVGCSLEGVGVRCRSVRNRSTQSK